jgi:hypothetical protein
MQSVITRMMTDRDFRHLAQMRPAEVLSEYELSPDELGALARRDLFKLQELGLEPWTARWVTSLR